MKRDVIHDRLKEFKPRSPFAIFGVRNGSYVAYVYDQTLYEKPWTPDQQSYRGKRYLVGAFKRDESLPGNRQADTEEEARELARGQVRGRAFRHLLSRMG